MATTPNTTPMTFKLPDGDVVELMTWDGIVLKLGEELSPLVNKIGDINTQLIRIDNRIEEWLEENNS